jgi:uncharacterized protein YkvS
VGNIVNSATATVTEKASAASEAVGNIVNSATATVTEKASAASEAVGNIVDSATATVTEKASAASKALGNIVDSATATVTEKASAASEAVGNIVNSVSGTATETVESIPEEAVISIEPTPENNAELETSIQTLSEELEKSVDPNTGAIPVDDIPAALDKLAPTLSDISEKLTAPTTDTQDPVKP